MKKATKIFLILGLILVVSILLLGFTYPFGGNSLANRMGYIPFHKDRLHLNGDYPSKVIQYQELDLFASFAIIEFETENELSKFELIYAKDDNIQRYESLYDTTSQTIFEGSLNYLPMDLNCGCYTLFVINQNQFDGGYFYHVYSFENKLYVYYTSR